MKNVAIVFLLLIPSIIRGQYVEEDSLTFPKYRHALGVDLTAPMTILMNATPNLSRFGLMYKYNLRPERTLRIHAFTEITDLFPEDEGLGTLAAFSDSTLSYIATSEREQKYAISGGFEWSHPQRAVTPIYGVDLILGYRQRDFSRHLQSYMADTTSAFFEADVNRMFGDTPQMCNIQRNIFVGADFSAGWRFRIKDHWEFIAQISPEVWVSVNSSTKMCEGATMTSSEVATNYIHMNLRLIDCFLFYRF